MVGGSKLLLADLSAEDDWLHRTPFEQAFIDSEFFTTFLTLAATAVISASMIDTIIAELLKVKIWIYMVYVGASCWYLPNTSLILKRETGADLS